MNIQTILAGALALGFVTTALAEEKSAPTPKTWVDQYDTLAAKYVTPKGVKYKAWHANAADRQQLSRIVQEIASANLSGKTRDEQLAFYLNAYNINILDKILQDYPTKGPGGGGLLGRNRFFKKKNLRVAGQAASFHTLENELIRPTFKEPRIHFALNCASESCPPLHVKGFRAATLNATLDALTKAFVNDNPLGVKPVGWKKVAVSKIFDWYEEDFKAAGGAMGYINQYRKTKLSKGTKISFQDYSWALNEAH